MSKIKREVLARVVLQQCISARLSTNVANESEIENAEFVEIANGIVVYICFLKNCTLSTIEKILKVVTSVKLSKNVDGKRVSIIDLPGDILIVPQATLGGQLKGKSMQYHNNIDKHYGEQLYNRFVEMCLHVLNAKTSDKHVKCGTYGNLQVLTISTNGPYTHAIDVV